MCIRDRSTAGSITSGWRIPSHLQRSYTFLFFFTFWAYLNRLFSDLKPAATFLIKVNTLFQAFLLLNVTLILSSVVMGQISTSSICLFNPSDYTQRTCGSHLQRLNHQTHTTLSAYPGKNICAQCVIRYSSCFRSFHSAMLVANLAIHLARISTNLAPSKFFLCLVDTCPVFSYQIY